MDTLARQASLHVGGLSLHLTDDGHVNGEPVERIVRTHSAELWFTEGLVFKHKRAVDLGFLDFTTLERRRAACISELLLNRRLAPDHYLGLCDIHDHEGLVVDVAVVMLRLPDEARLSTLLTQDIGLDDAIRDVARQLAVFHEQEPPHQKAEHFAARSVLARNWDDNFEVLRHHSWLVDRARIDDLQHDVDDFLEGRERLFAGRIEDGLVRDGHGDLLTTDIFVVDETVVILDCLDFLDDFRIGDVLLDVAFLAMDLEHRGRTDLAELFLSTYLEFTDQHHHVGLLHHFIAYRASVRAKVTCLAIDAGDVDVSADEPDALVDLALRHTTHGRPRLILVGGLPGTGKSTLSERLADALDASWLRSDETRKDLLGVPHDTRAPEWAYGPAATQATYEYLIARAEKLLRMGDSVILDATWSTTWARDRAEELAATTSSEIVAFECVTTAEVTRQRLADRIGNISDADASIHTQMAATWVPWRDSVHLDTTGDRDGIARTALRSVLRRSNPSTNRSPT